MLELNLDNSQLALFEEIIQLNEAYNKMDEEKNKLPSLRKPNDKKNTQTSLSLKNHSVRQSSLIDHDTTDLQNLKEHTKPYQSSISVSLIKEVNNNLSKMKSEVTCSYKNQKVEKPQTKILTLYNKTNNQFYKKIESVPLFVSKTQTPNQHLPNTVLNDLDSNYKSLPLDLSCKKTPTSSDEYNISYSTGNANLKSVIRGRNNKKLFSIKNRIYSAENKIVRTYIPI